MDAVELNERISRLYSDHPRGMSLLGDSIFAKGEEGVLLCLHQGGRDLLSGELVDYTGLTTGRISNILRRLEEKKLVKRLPDGGDRRRVVVHLTEQGRAEAETMYQRSLKRSGELMCFLGESDGGEAIRLLERCLSYIEANYC